MRRRTHSPGLLALLACGASLGAGAQPAPADLEAVQRTQQRNIREAQDRPLPQADVFVQPPPQGPRPESLPAHAGPCLPVALLELQGHAPALGPAPPLPQAPACMDERALNALLGSLNAHYQQAGWITTRVYVDPQSAGDGVLRLRVIPGRIEDTVLAGGLPDARLPSAFPERPDRLLNLRDLEQGLENINRLPSQQGQFTLLPGAESGSSRVEIGLQQSRRVRLTEMVDNSGTAALGRWKSTTELAVDNPSGHNDQLALGLITNLDQGELDARFRGLTLNYFIPNGYHLLSVSGSAIRTAFTLPGINASYPLHTRADKLGVGYDYLFARDQISKHSVTTGLDITRQHTTIADVEVPSQERRLTVLHLGYKGKLLWGRQSHEWALRLERGLQAFNAQTQLSDGSNPQYHLLRLRLASTWPLPDNRGLLRTLVQAQAAPANTPTLAQIYVGGRYDVRGYQQNSLYAPSGAFVRSEYESPAFNWGASRWHAYLGVDAGRVQTLPNRPLSQQHLSGGALGLRGEMGPLRIDLARVRALSRPLEFSHEARERWYVLLSLVH